MTVIIAAMVSTTILRLRRSSYATVRPIASFIISHVASVIVVAVGTTSLTVVSETTTSLVIVSVRITTSTVVLLAIATIYRIFGRTARSVMIRLLITLVTVDLTIGRDGCRHLTIVLRTSI
jgi:hypothetical protein